MDIDYSQLPHHMQAGMRRYIERGIPPGDFLTAILCNDFMEACGHGDDINRNRMFDYAVFLYNEAPPSCYGSREAFKAWVGRGGLNQQKENE